MAQFVSAATSSGAQSEQDQLVATCLPLVDHIVRETARRLPAQVGIDALHSAGRRALEQAAACYELGGDAQFSRLAASWIRAALLEVLNQYDADSAPCAADLPRAGGRMETAIAALPDRLREVIAAYFYRQRSIEEIAVELGLSATEVRGLKAEALCLLRGGASTLALATVDGIATTGGTGGRGAGRDGDAMPDAAARVDGVEVEAKRAAYRAMAAQRATLRSRQALVGLRADGPAAALFA